jgi:hypothetical protein
MGPIAERFFLRMATSAEFHIALCFDEISIGVNEIYISRNSNRSALGIDKNFWIRQQNLPSINLIQKLIEVIAQDLATRWVTQFRHRL